MTEECGNCKHMKSYNDGRLFPHKCKKEKPGISHGIGWLTNRCDKWELREEKRT